MHVRVRMCVCARSRVPLSYSLIVRVLSCPLSHTQVLQLPDVLISKCRDYCVPHRELKTWDIRLDSPGRRTHNHTRARTHTHTHSHTHTHTNSLPLSHAHACTRTMVRRVARKQAHARALSPSVASLLILASLAQIWQEHAGGTRSSTFPTLLRYKNKLTSHYGPRCVALSRSSTPPSSTSASSAPPSYALNAAHKTLHPVPQTMHSKSQTLTLNRKP